MTTSHFDPTEQVAVFSVQACADPGTLSRILELFAKRGLVPAFLKAERTGDRGDELAIEIRMNGMDHSLAVYIGECLRRIYTVEQVFVSELRRTAVA